VEKQHPLRYSWKIRTNSPELVLTTLANAIEDSGYRLHKRPQTAWPGSEVIGRRIIASPKPRMLLLGLASIAGAIGLFYNSLRGSISTGDIFQIVVGITLSVLGILFIIDSSKLFRLSLVGRIERETYHTGADMVESIVTAHILGNRRPIWITFDRNRQQNDKIPREQLVLEENFNELQFRLESILPALAGKRPH